LTKRFYIVKNKTSGETGVEGTNSRGTFTFIKKEQTDPKPTGATVYELDKFEAAICRMSILFNDYSSHSDSEFATHYEKFTENDKNEGRKIRLAITAWSAKNTSAWPNSYHEAVWINYDSLEQRLSDGALTPAYLVSLSIPNIINDPITTDNIDVTSLNTLIAGMFDDAFDKYPR
jgi:hypothetical protein